MKTILILFIAFYLPATINPQTYFQKISTGPIVNTMNYNNMTAGGDYDNDGDIDIVESAYNDNCPECLNPLLFFRNEGDGNFSRIYDNAVAQASVSGSGLAWGDYDNDGWLDLFVCGTVNSRNKLFHNEQNGNFTEVTSGEIVTELNSSQACGWSDYDKDGWLDIFVANRYGIHNNRLYKNNGNGTFTKILEGSIVNDISESRGCAWGDYDNDGWPDLFVVNYEGRNDFLYHNDHNGNFTKITSVPMANDGLWGSCAEWIDFDNNGYMDLYVTNNNGNNKLYCNHGDGYFTLSNSLPYTDVNSYGFSWGDYDNDGFTDLFTCGKNSANKLFKNNDSSVFTLVTNEIITQEGQNSITSSFTDFNMDGKLDMIISNRFGFLYNYFYKNIGNTGNYITLKLNGCNSNRKGVGAKITVVNGELRQYKEITSGSAWSAENTLWPHFGTGASEVVDSIIVFWPSGEITRLSSVNTNSVVNIDECLGVIGIGEENNYISHYYKLEQNYPNPFNPITQLEYLIMNSCFVTMKVYDGLGREVSTLVNDFIPAGSHKIKFDGSNLNSGIYFYRLSANGFVSVKKMILLK